MRVWMNLTVLTAHPFACQALAVLTGQAKAGWQARVSLEPRRRGWIQKQTLPRSYLPNRNVLERSYTFGDDGAGPRVCEINTP